MEWRPEYTFIVAVTLVVYAVAAIAIAHADQSIFSDYGYPTHNGGDSSEYALLTERLATNGFFTLDGVTPEMFRSPGYSLFLTPLYSIDPTFILAIVVQILLVAVSALLLFNIAETVLPLTWSYIVTFAFVLDPTTLFYSVAIFSDTLFVFLLLLVTYLLLQPTLRRIVFAAILLGSATLVRTAGEYLVVVYAAFIAAPYYPRGITKMLVMAAVFVAITFAVLAPWYVRNAAYSNTYALSTTGVYSVLFFDIHDFLMKEKGISSDEARDLILAQLPTQDEVALRDVRYIKSMSALIRKYVYEYPVQYAIFHLTGSVNLYLSSSIRDAANNLPVFHRTLQSMYLMGDNEINIKSLFATNPLQALWVSIFGEPLLTLERVFRLLTLVFAVVACFAALADSKNRQLLFLCAAIVAYTALIFGPVSYPRYRMSAEPFLFILAAYGVHAKGYQFLLLLRRLVWRGGVA